MVSTYSFLFDNCSMLFEREYDGPPPALDKEGKPVVSYHRIHNHPQPNSLSNIFIEFIFIYHDSGGHLFTIIFTGDTFIDLYALAVYLFELSFPLNFSFYERTTSKLQKLIIHEGTTPQ